jgi:hypothetical protein
VLLYAFWPGAALHSPIRNWLTAAIRGQRRILLPDIVLSGFVRIVTGGKLVILAEPLDNALLFCERLLAAPACELVRPREGHWPRFTDLCRRVNAVGNIVPDAYLAALALEDGAEFITCNRDFARFPGLAWRHPLDAQPTTNPL